MSELFSITCQCDFVYSPEVNKECPQCHVGIIFHKDLKLDIPKFLSEVYELVKQNKNAKAIDKVFDVFWHLHDKFDIMNDIIGEIDYSKLNASLLVGFMVQTFKYADQVPNHSMLCNKSFDRMKELGKTDEEASRLVDDYRETGNYWKNMKTLGAPEWLTGPKPKD